MDNSDPRIGGARLAEEVDRSIDMAEKKVAVSQG